MKWLELSVQVPSEFVEPISYLFSRHGRSVSIEEVGGGQVVLRTYLASTARQRRARIEVGVKLIGALKPIQDLQVRALDDVDWEEAWKRHFTLLKTGRSLVIKPPWIDYQARNGDHVIKLDPGLAFGTGHHPTTHMCLEALEDMVRPGMSILDLGVGSGILSIAAAKLGACSVVALDVDPLAVKVARRSFGDNGVKGQIKLARGSLPHKLAPECSFHLAVANISAKVLESCAPHLLVSLRPGGKLIAAGFLEEQEAQVMACLSQVGFSFEDRRSIEDWVTGVFHKAG